MKDLDALKLKEGFDKFKAARSPGDPDLVDLLRQGLVNFGFSADCQKAYEANPLVQEAADKTPDIQRFQLNRFWVQQFCTLKEENTMEIRHALALDGTVEEWLKIQQAYVLPFAKQKGLPVVIV